MDGTFSYGFNWGKILNWLVVVRRWAIQHGMDPTDLRVLDAFGWQGEQFQSGEDTDDSMLSLEEDVERIVGGLSERIGEQLSGEVDVEQAQMFGRRVAGVLGLMAPMLSTSPWMRVLRVAFVRRLIQVLDVSNPPATKPPRALRVRAVADYFFSLAATEFHRAKRDVEGRKSRSFVELLEDIRWHRPMAGMRWAHIEGDISEGPFHATVMVIDPRLYRVEAVERQNEGIQNESLQVSARRLGLVAAVSGGFFLYSEPDIVPPSQRFDPVGLLVRNGRILNPPCFGRPAFVQYRSGRCDIVSLGLLGLFVTCDGHRVEVDGVHWRGWTRVHGIQAPPGSFQVAISAGEICEISSTGSLDVPLNGMVLIGEQVPWRVGSHVEFSWRDGEDPIENAVAGGPNLLSRSEIELDADGFAGTAPPRTFSGDETGDCNLLPRMAVGLNGDEEVVFVAVDGRNFDRSLGLTLGGMADLMRAMGCVHAMNLDGGSSKRLVIDGVVRDLPATEVVGGRFKPVGVRPVRTALYWRHRTLN